MAEDQPQGKVHWLRLALIGVAFVGVSIGMGYLFEGLLSSVQISENVPMWIGLSVVFGLMIAINLTLLPLPFGVSLMIAAAGFWNPVLVGLAGSLGATLGEFSGYFFGTLGKRVSIGENVPTYKMVRRWVLKYGMWAIAFVSFQPVIPFDVGGFVAGVTRMPVRQFLPAIWIGKFPKYLILIFLGDTLIHIFPSLGF